MRLPGRLKRLQRRTHGRVAHGNPGRARIRSRSRARVSLRGQRIGHEVTDVADLARLVILLLHMTHQAQVPGRWRLSIGSRRMAARAGACQVHLQPVHLDLLRNVTAAAHRLRPVVVGMAGGARRRRQRDAGLRPMAFAAGKLRVARVIEVEGSCARLFPDAQRHRYRYESRGLVRLGLMTARARKIAPPVMVAGGAVGGRPYALRPVPRTGFVAFAARDGHVRSMPERARLRDVLRDAGELRARRRGSERRPDDERGERISAQAHRARSGPDRDSHRLRVELPVPLRRR
jgi:hypothetical protein